MSHSEEGLGSAFLAEYLDAQPRCIQFNVHFRLCPVMTAKGLGNGRSNWLPDVWDDLCSRHRPAAAAHLGVHSKD